MKRKIIPALLLVFMILQTIIHSCGNTRKLSGEAAVKKYFYLQTDSLLHKLDILDSMVSKGQPVSALQSLFVETRFTYKKIESITEYYFQGLTKRMNGPALPDIKTEDGQVWPPHGFQVIEQYIYDGYNASLANDVSNEIKLLQTDLRFVKSNLEHHTILPHHLQEIIQHQFIRIAALGISGFDAPFSKLSLPEAENSLAGIKEIFEAYYDEKEKAESNEIIFGKTVDYLKQHNDFDSFNRMEFLISFLMPVSETFKQSFAVAGNDSLTIKPFQGTLVDLLKGQGFDADYYTSYAIARTNPAKAELGKQLFFEKNLSKSGTISCASCHQPGLYFTDAKIKAEDFVHGGSLMRNTPSLYYAAFQSHQFYDLRSITLEDQANEVMKSSSEFNFNSSALAKKLLSDKKYEALFRKAFNFRDTISGFEVRNALASFVRSLSPFSSRFDEYMNGDKTAMTKEEINGFNLFMGKSKCGTCHFLPLFNGNIPPWYNKSESEIIGVPEKVIWDKATIDNDSGRYKINRLNELMFAFKTPTVRNSEKTAPYMHNGVYNSLEDVIEFYHKGGGTGIGIDLPFQSLPFDSLSLNAAEKKAVIVFLKSLTDNKTSY